MRRRLLPVEGDEVFRRPLYRTLEEGVRGRVRALRADRAGAAAGAGCGPGARASESFSDTMVRSGLRRVPAEAEGREG